MECEICNRNETDTFTFICASCARSTVYLSRLEQARVLLEKEKLGTQVEEITERHDKSRSSPTESILHNQNVWRNEIKNVESMNAKTRLESIRNSLNTIRSEIDSLHEAIAQRRINVNSRKESLKSIENTIPTRRQTLVSSLGEVWSRNSTNLNHLDYKSATNKAYLCRETAHLMRLRQKRKHKDGITSEQYSLAGLPLPNLREINNSKCTELTAVLTSVAHLVMLVSFYLGVRLPAEITVPYRDYPLPTINTPSNSYLGKKIDFPGSGSIPSISSSPSASRHDNRGSHRPRPLFVGSDDKDERLANVAKKEPLAFNFFVEGIALLAWNVAWLCRSQGFTVGTNSWEDICDIGKNLFQLILSPPQPAAISRLNSDRNLQRRKKSSSPIQEKSQESIGKLGQASHMSTKSFLGDFAHSENIRNWKYSKYTTIADALRKTLLTEMNNAEWELLQEQEWDDGGEQFGDEAVFIKTRAMDGHEYNDARSIMTTKTQVEDFSTAKVPGTSGWTKLKSRERS